jgi:hypothetical protein
VPLKPRPLSNGVLFERQNKTIISIYLSHHRTGIGQLDRMRRILQKLFSENLSISNMDHRCAATQTPRGNSGHCASAFAEAFSRTQP